MEHQFWHKKWETNELGFHQDDFNPVLVRHWAGLDIPGGSKVFVPLCGKSKDMLWLAGQGYDVVGVELSEIAARSFFEEHGMDATRSEVRTVYLLRVGSDPDILWRFLFIDAGYVT